MFLSLCFLLTWMPQDHPVQEQLQVSLSKTVVRVRDNKGKPARGLTRESFKLKVDGKQVEVSHFEEHDLPQFGQLEVPEEQVPPVKPDSSGNRVTNLPKRSIVLLIDTSTMSPEGYEKTKPVLDQYFAALPNGVAVKLAQLEKGYIRQLTPFTTNRKMLVDSLAGITYSGRVYRLLDQAQNTINHGLNDMAKRRGNMMQTMDTYVEGKRRIKQAHMRTFSLGINALAQILDPLPGDRSIWVVSGGGYLDKDTSYLLDRETSELNARNIPVHTLLATDKYAIGTRTVTAEWNDEFSLDVKQGSIYRPNDYRETTQAREVMPEQTSDDTGGAFIKSDDVRTLAEKLAQVDERASHYYVLFYKTQKPNHKLDVKLATKRRGWKLDFGQQVGYRVPYHKLKDKDRELEFFATLQYGTDSGGNFLPVNWDFYEFASSMEPWTVSVGAQVDTTNRAEGPYEIGIALLDEDRQPLAVRHKVLGKLPKHQAFTFYDMVQAGVRPSFISCTLRDLTNAQLNQRVFLLDPPKEGEGPELSSLVFLEPGVQRPVINLRQIGEKQDEMTDPFEVKGGRIPPGFSRDLAAPKAVGVFFRLLKRQGAHRDYEVGLVLTRNRARIDVPISVKLSEDDGKDQSYFLCDIQTEGLPPGQYQVMVRVAHTPSGTATIVSRNLHLVAP